MKEKELFAVISTAPRRLFGLGVLAAALCLTLVFGVQPAWADEASAPQKTGLVQADGVYRYYEKGAAVKSAWKTVDGAKYYFDAKGAAVAGGAKKIKDKYYIFGDNGKLLKPKKSKIYQLKKGVYYVNKKGQPAGKGWCVVKDRLYKVGASGKCVTNKTVDGIILKSNGAAKEDKSTELKMYVMLIMEQVTTPDMSRKQKLRKCFDYVLKSSKYANSQEPKDIGKKGWAQRAALKVLQRKKYDCFGFACTISAFAYELGYKPTIRGKALKHAFCLIDGKAYDMVGPRFGTKPLKVAGARNWKYRGWDASQPKPKGWVTKKNARYYYDAKGKACTGPRKISGKYYVFDSKGKLLQNKVGKGSKTTEVKVDGKTYRVNNQGVAVAGWAKAKKTLYLTNGRKATGLTSYKGKLYWFSAQGVKDAAKTSKIQTNAKLNKNAATLLKLIGKPVKSRTEASCNPRFVEQYPDGKDVIMTFDNATLEFFKTPSGTMYLTNVG